MEEKWINIKGYEGIYMVSNLGNIKSLNRIINNRWGNFIKSGNIIKKFYDDYGYHKVNLYKNFIIKQFFVHKLVVENFTNNKTSFTNQVNHIDRNKINNNILNLEVCSPIENIRKSRINQKGEQKPNSRLKDKDVREIRSLKGIMTITELAYKFKCGRTTIWQSQSGQQWKHIK